ncbi:MAG: HAMP domain-containing protein [Spirochaetaceae bacterium]|jgi:adenylate cyclase|nr:HAMP domain-containing protein [Spirochaetaceae bacterium]
MTNTDAAQKSAVRFSIGFKLITIISILLLLSLGAITVLVSVMVGADVRVTAEENNFSVNRRSASEAELLLSMTRSNTLALLDTLDALEGVPGGVAAQTTDFFFERNPDLAFIGLLDEGGFSRTLVNEQFFAAAELDSSAAAAFAASRPDAASRCARGELVLLNASPAFGVPVLAMYCPRPRGGETGAVIFFGSDSLAETFGEGGNVSLMINDDGDILVHPDPSLLRAGESFKDDPFDKIVRESPDRRFQTLYTGAGGARRFGAFQKLTLANVAVITSVEEAVVLEGVAATTRRNVFLTGVVLFLGVLCIWFFSKTLSVPLKNLAAAAGRIENGEFEVKLEAKTRDELGLLTRSFVSMGRGLAERERLKETFGRFTNREIAERALRGELSLGGETKQVTVFFSDIRAFTEISEKLEPQEVVEFLNDYMTRMVDCVDKTGGVVDKFIGDAVMAVWGAPVSAGSPARDAFNCVKAALMMRNSLREFNKDRGGPRKPLIRIGCGINTGNVVAGQIGSSQRMEYTVIGDTVNLASRTEALNKPFHTDILITEDTWGLLKSVLIVEEMAPVSVKGKEKPVRMFAVVNLKPQTGKLARPANLKELRTLLGLSAPDLQKVDLSGEEKKYKIG